MKKILLLTVLLITYSNNTFSQDYIPFLNNTSWNMQIFSWSGVQYQWIENEGTAEIDSHTYTKYSNIPMEVGDVFVREDIAARRVYRYKNNEEQLLYDFSLEVSDVVTLSNGNEYVVTSKDSIPVVTGRKRVRLGLTPSSGTLNSETWIEGVGSTHNPLMPSFEIVVSDPHISLYCSYNGITPVYNFGLANTGNPSECPEATMDIIENYFDNVSIYPNPFSSSTIIHFNEQIHNANLKIYNIQGQLIKEKKNISGDKITLTRENLTQGIYIIQVLQQSGQSYTTRIIVAD